MRASILGWCLAALALCGAACEEYGPRVYTARLYRVGARCLEPYTPIGVVQAGELDVDCEQCLLLDGALYVSRVCPPLPARADAVTPDDAPACALALAAFTAELTCGASDAGLDGGLDGGPDASDLETTAGP